MGRYQFQALSPSQRLGRFHAGATATKVVFKEKIANSADFVVDGKKYTARTSKEVILSAGTIQSPQLLELSGIGNQSLLKTHGIKVIVNNPNFGEDLQEHHCRYEFARFLDLTPQYCILGSACIS